MSLILKIAIILNLSLLTFAQLSNFRITCKDENGNPVDWFTAYKLPSNSASPDINIKGGVGYNFLSENNQNWTFSRRGFNESGSVIGQTLSSFYSSNFNNPSNPMGYVMYNDQFEHQELASRAHSKGVIFFDSLSAIWVVHSIPHFPPRPISRMFTLGGGQTRYGQSMICLSLPLSALEQVGRQLLFAWPQIYDSFIPTSMQNNPFLNNLIRVANGSKYNVPKTGFADSDPLGWANRENIVTLENNSVSTFYKHTKFAGELYSGFVAPQLQSELYTETWSNGVGTLPSDCSQSFPVYNIKQVRFPAINVTFRVNSDHSKWAVSNPRDASRRVLCVGDINRQNSQTKRGGGTICMNNEPTAWNSWRNLVDELESCSV